MLCSSDISLSQNHDNTLTPTIRARRLVIRSQMRPQTQTLHSHMTTLCWTNEICVSPSRNVFNFLFIRNWTNACNLPSSILYLCVCAKYVKGVTCSLLMATDLCKMPSLNSHHPLSGASTITKSAMLICCVSHLPDRKVRSRFPITICSRRTH